MHKKKKGDTLIEVAFAIGIFSMVAITVVSVISASTNGAQSALETTITREDLDSQAEALRFIHEAYVSGSQSADTSENIYYSLWKALTALAVNESTANLAYNPTTCSEVYNSGGTVKRANSGQIPFVINIRQLNDPSSANRFNVIIRSGPASNTKNYQIFYPATTFPRIIYGTSASGSATTNEELYIKNEYQKNTIQRVEGIYIVAVKDDSSKVVSETGIIETKSAYYDFYIRSCWMPNGVDRASTISTVIRLYDPAAICYGSDCT